MDLEALCCRCVICKLLGGGAAVGESGRVANLGGGRQTLRSFLPDLHRRLVRSPRIMFTTTTSQVFRRVLNTSSTRIVPAALKPRPVLLRAPAPPHLALARSFHASLPKRHGGLKRPEPGTGLKVTFKDSKDNVIRTVECNEGDDLLSVAHEYDIDLEGESVGADEAGWPSTAHRDDHYIMLITAIAHTGACERSCSCSTCHVILTDPEVYDRLLEDQDMSDDEADMLDLAFGLTET